MADAKYSPIGELLVHAVQLIEGGAVPEKSPRELALALDSTDFEGANTEVRIGVNYLKGRMQNLEDDLRRAQSAYTDLTDTLAKERSESGQVKWKYESLQRKWDDIDALQKRLAELMLPDPEED